MPPGAAIEEGLVGTLAYMAPEQASGRPEAASDWYAVGVMLYEALSGRLPFTGTAMQIIGAKRARDPEPVQALAPEVPDDLSALCMALLSRDPAKRPQGSEVVTRLGRQPRRAWAAGASVVSDTAAIGREAQIAALDAALRNVRGGHAVVACLHGSTGFGKTALTHWFTRNRLPHRALVLQSRCYVRESVPYKALDGIIEQLGWHLHSLSARELDCLLPKHVNALVHVFPVLTWLADVHATNTSGKRLDPSQLRRDAFDALRELLGRLAAGRPLDTRCRRPAVGRRRERARAGDLLRQPGQPGVLLIVAFRTDDIEKNAFIESLIDRARVSESAFERHEIELGPLSEVASRELASRLVSVAPCSPRQIDNIVREARGVPFLIELFSRYLAESGTSRDDVVLDRLISTVLDDLPEGCRELLDAVAVSGRPIDTMLVREATAVAGNERRLVGALQGAYLVRPAGSAATIEPYHDRVREAVVGRLSAARLAAIHLSLARAMESRGVDEPETLSEHYLEGGERALAAIHAARAAAAASAQLAFERAAKLYRRALELTPDTTSHAVWKVALAHVLAYSGSGVEAAHAYLDAASAPGVDAAAMYRAAADHLLRCGHVQEGLEVVDRLAVDAGLDVQRNRFVTIGHVLVSRGLLRIKGWRFTERPEREIDRSELMRIDLGITLGTGLARVDGLRAADYHARAARRALGAGEPVRVTHAMLGEVAFGCLRGGRTLPRTLGLLDRAAALADRLEHPHLNGLVHLVRCMAYAHAGQFNIARPEADVAEQIFRRQCVDVWRDIDPAQVYSISLPLLPGRIDRAGTARAGAAAGGDRARRPLRGR